MCGWPSASIEETSHKSESSDQLAEDFQQNRCCVFRDWIGTHRMRIRRLIPHLEEEL